VEPVLVQEAGESTDAERVTVAALRFAALALSPANLGIGSAQKPWAFALRGRVMTYRRTDCPNVCDGWNAAFAGAERQGDDHQRSRAILHFSWRGNGPWSCIFPFASIV